MSTRAAIGYYDNETNEVKSIYLHHDGYLKGAGETLNRFYDTEDKVKKLISLGNLSVLGKKPEDVGHEYWIIVDGHFLGDWNKLKELIGDKCVGYRFRNSPQIADETEDPDTFKSIEDFDFGYRDIVDYIYLFKDGRWEVIE